MQTNIKHIDLKLNQAKSVIEKFNSLGLKKNNFCLVPFTTIILEPNGNVGVCRLHGTDEAIGNLKDNTIEEIWNGQALRRWRQEFLNENPEICKTSINNNHCNLCIENNTLLEHVEFRDIQTSPIKKLTANFNGFCNLKCIMCDIWKLPNGHYTEDNFWKSARKNIFPNLHEIDMLSGEPFLQDDTYKLMREVSNVNDSCQWSITTNAHWKLNTKIKKHLDLIKVKNLILSIDSVTEETYSKIRVGGRLKTVLENVTLLLAYQEERLQNGQSSLNLYANFLIQKDNWQEIASMIKYCADKGIMPFISFCERPKEFSLLDLSEKERVLVLEFYFKTFTNSEIYLSLRVIRPLVFSLSGASRADFLMQLHDVTEGRLL